MGLVSFSYSPNDSFLTYYSAHSHAGVSPNGPCIPDLARLAELAVHIIVDQQAPQVFDTGPRGTASSGEYVLVAGVFRPAGSARGFLTTLSGSGPGDCEIGIVQWTAATSGAAPAPLPASATTYQGRTETGAPVSISLNETGTAVTGYRFGLMPPAEGPPIATSPCGLWLAFAVWDGLIPLVDGTFTHILFGASITPPSEYDIVVTGTVEAGRMSGTIAWVHPDTPECNTPDVTWSATPAAP